MKKFVFLSLAMVSALSFGDEPFENRIQVGRSAQAVRVNSVHTERVGEHGFPSTRVLVQATFSNSCVVPKPDELVKIAQYSKSYSDLILTLASDSQRICPMHYAPVTVTIDLGVFTRPNDGLFKNIVVNGKSAN